MYEQNVKNRKLEIEQNVWIETFETEFLKESLKRNRMLKQTEFFKHNVETECWNRMLKQNVETECWNRMMKQNAWKEC